MERMLTIKEISEILQVNERTIHRMIQSGKIPATKVGNQWRFHPLYIEDWLLKGGEAAEPFQPFSMAADVWKNEEEFQLFAPERIRLDIQADSTQDALRQLVDIMVDTGHLLQGKLFYQAVMERESVSTTGIGNGVALPHGWHPINDLFRVPLIACARFTPPVEFQAVDGQPVDLAFLICTPRSRKHLKLLRSLSLLAQETETLALLRAAKTPEEFMTPLTETVTSAIA